MKIVVDESVDGRIVKRLRDAGHAVISIAEVASGAPDHQVLAHSEGVDTLLVTADKDFGELVYRQKLANCGVVLLRQAGLSVGVRADALLAVLDAHASELPQAFTVLSPDMVRMRKPPHTGA